VRPARRRLGAGYFELEPVALFEMMDAPIESEQELKAMVLTRRLISSGDMITHRPGTRFIGKRIVTETLVTAMMSHRPVAGEIYDGWDVSLGRRPDLMRG
jgi:hypothetical protein